MNIVNIINEELIRLNEFLTRDGVSLLRYLSMTDDERKRGLPYMYNYSYDEYLEDTGEESNYEIGDYFEVESMSAEDFNKFAEWLYNKVEDHSLNVSDAEYPAWSFFDNSPQLIKNQWLIHFTNNPDNVATEGFTHGVDEIDKLGLTTYLSDIDKKYGGFNFAYTLHEFSKYAQNRHGYKYGDYAVIFRASGVKVWHYSDEEPQVIFYGSTATNIIPITAGENSTYGIYDVINGRLLYENDKMENMVKWIESNYNQYRKHLHY